MGIAEGYLKLKNKIDKVNEILNQNRYGQDAEYVLKRVKEVLRDE